MADSKRETEGQGGSEDSVQDNGQISSRPLPSVRIFDNLSPSCKPHLVAVNNETRFTHLSSGSLYCTHLEKLQKHVDACMEFKLTQECLKRYVSAVNFTKKLETYAEHELSRLDGIHRHELSKHRRLAFEYYHKLCREAQIHLNHWCQLECKTRRQVRSSELLLKMLSRIQKFKCVFLSLQRQILFWLHRIGLSGLRILANASFKQLSSTVDLQNFLQGIEKLNHMLSTDVQQSYHKSKLYNLEEENACRRLRSIFSNVPLSSLNIVEILGTVCVERAKLLAKLTHENFTHEDKAVELQDFLSTTRFSWTFEGHLSTEDLLECTGNVRYGKLQSVMKKYGHKEEEFIKQLLDTLSVSAFLHHENEVRRRSSEVCERHAQLTDSQCTCNTAQRECVTCQMSDSTIKAIMDGSDVSEFFAITDGSEFSDLTETSPEAMNQDRRSLFMELQPTKLKFQLCSIYKDDLWNRFSLAFYDSLQSLRWPYVADMSIGAVCCWSTAVVMGIIQHLDNLASTGPFSETAVQSIRVVSRSLYLNAVLASLDSLHCLMIAVGQADKCKYTTVIDGVASTKTSSLMVQTCSVFQHFFSTASNWKELKPEETNLTTPNSLTLRIEDVFDRFGVFLSYCVYWFTTKVKHFMAGWSLPPFLLVSQYELSILMKSINTTLQLMEHMHCQLENVCSHGVLVKYHWDQMERKAGHLQVIEVESWENFKQKFIEMASDFWHEMMPKGRVWKRSRNSGSLPSEPSSYVEHAIIQVLQPVIEGVLKLPLGLQNCILVQAVEIMMDTWSSHILKEEIQFSVIGAYQLQVDFNYVKLWLTSDACTLDTSVQSDLAILDVFRQLNEAAHLLMIQPKKKRKKITTIENGLEQELASNSSTISGSSVLSGNSSYDGDPELLNNQLIPNKDQWLNLRLRKGKPRMPLVIPACLRSAEQT